LKQRWSKNQAVKI